jgi:hypothetical protein
MPIPVGPTPRIHVSGSFLSIQPTYTLIVSGERFKMTTDQITFDPGNAFAKHFSIMRRLDAMEIKIRTGIVQVETI